MELVEEGGYKFTIGYTTYNRKGLTIRRLNSLLAMDIPGNVEIIIVDNASSDGTFKAISDLTNGTKIKVYRNNENLGFSGNFVEVFRRAKGDYVMWSSDKDEVNLSGVQSLLDWIGSEKNPDIVVLNYYRKMKLKNHYIFLKRLTEESLSDNQDARKYREREAYSFGGVVPNLKQKITLKETIRKVVKNT